MRQIVFSAPRKWSLTGRSSHEMMNETFRQSPGGNTNHSVLIGTGLGAAEQNIMNRLSSHHLCWASAPFRGHMTAVSQQWYSATTRLRRTLGLQCCTVQTKWHFSHPQNVCWLLFYVSHHAHLFRNDFWLFRKKLCDSVVRNCSELKSQVFMNGKLAFGRCNTYFNVTFFFMPLYCAMSWVLIRLKYHRDKQCFFLQPVVRLFFFFNATIQQNITKDRRHLIKLLLLF